MDIAEQIRLIARHAWLYGGDSQLDVSECIAGDDLVKLDLAHDPPILIREDRELSAFNGTGVTVVDATSEQLQAVLNWLQANPPHPETIEPLDILGRFTVPEQNQIASQATALFHRLCMATHPVAWPTFEAGVKGLAEAGIISSARATEILRVE